MDLGKFEKLSNAPKPAKYLVLQDWGEWKAFLEFVDGYFKNRNIMKPLVVEIGIMHNEQQTFYRHLLDAEYISIDININNNSDIVGDSADPETLKELKKLLAGREIDLLFIDGDHSYEGIKSDHELYGPLVKHLIAFHDVHAVTNRAFDVNTYWNEMAIKNHYLTVVFHHYNSDISIDENKFANMGIGVVIKG